VPFNLGTGELLLILFVALLVLGPTKLPEAARQIGKAMTEFRRVSSGFQAELRDALKEPVDGVPRTAATEPTPTLPPIEDPNADHEGTSGPNAA
jgi:Tat protein translocase TatB subunit